jgi:hypothetical protein
MTRPTSTSSLQHLAQLVDDNQNVLTAGPRGPMWAEVALMNINNME